MDVLRAVRIVLDEVEHIAIVCVEEADVVMTAQLNGEDVIVIVFQLMERFLLGQQIDFRSRT